jgi:hypothetical protein
MLSFFEPAGAKKSKIIFCGGAARAASLARLQGAQFTFCTPQKILLAEHSAAFSKKRLRRFFRQSLQTEGL